MTITDANKILYEWLSKHHTFNMATDLKKLVLLSEDYDLEEAAIHCAFKEFEEIGMVDKHSKTDPKTKKENTIWVLRNPIDTSSQNIEISGELAVGLAEIINNFCTIVGEKDYKCDPLMIKDSDLASLLQIINVLADRIQKLEGGADKVD